MVQTHDGSTVTHSLTYDAFGSVKGGVEPYEVLYAFNGEEYSDTTQLQYLRARYYAPELAAFISKDTELGTPTRINSFNRFAFAEGDPVNNFDPTGHAIGNTTYERQMEAAGGINELYNFYVGNTLQASLNRAQAGFNAQLNYAKGVDYTSARAINSIAGISQETANAYIQAGAGAAVQVGRNYGCTPGSLTQAAFTNYAQDVVVTRDTVNTQIARVQQNKVRQYNAYQAYLAEQAEKAQKQAEADAQAAAQAAADSENTRRANLAQKINDRVNKTLNTILGAAYKAANIVTANAHYQSQRVDWNAVATAAAIVVVGVIAIATIAMTAGAATMIWGAAIGAALGGSAAALSFGTAVAATGIAAVTVGTAAVTISSATEAMTGHNPVRDNLLGGDQTAYDMLSMGTAFGYAGIMEPVLASGAPSKTGSANAQTAKPTVGATTSQATPANPVVTTRVGRWMSETEYDSMVSTGKVQVSTGGGSVRVANPADPNAYRAAPKGDLYVEFDIDSNLLRPAGNNFWSQIPGPGSVLDRADQRRGLAPIVDMPKAYNIELLGRK